MECEARLLPTSLMKIQIASDLHFEFLPPQSGQKRLIPRAPEADVLVLAGDVAAGLDALELFGDWPIPVLYVAGNHEHYSRDMKDIRDRLRSASAGTAVRFMDNEVEVIGGTRFLGTTLWTDYRLYEPAISQQMAMRAAGRGLNDHRLIRLGTRAFSSDDALAEHVAAKAWLEKELCTPYSGPTVVITHHGPHVKSIHPQYAGDVLSPAFSSDLSDLLPHASLWIHGHVHNSFDYVAAGCRVVANPRGYPTGRCSTGQLTFENAKFEPVCVVEVPLSGDSDGSSAPPGRGA